MDLIDDPELDDCLIDLTNALLRRINDTGFDDWHVNSISLALLALTVYRTLPATEHR